MSELEPEATPETEHFGFTRIGDGEALSKNGYAFSDGDRIALDDLIYALEHHNHSAHPRLADPADLPTVTTVANSGILPAGTTLYYVVSYLDMWGLETTASPEVLIQMPVEIPPPDAPVGAVESGLGGLPAGVYGYTLSAVTAAAEETTAENSLNIQVPAGIDNRIILTLPDLPVGAVGFRVYRSRPGQTQMYYLAEASGITWIDDGSVAEDATVEAPVFNTTNSTNAVEVTIPGGVIPEGAIGWRIYRSLAPGTYDGYNLVHQVTEGVDELDTTPRTTWLDTGEALEQGEPRRTSATISGGRSISLNELSGRFPIEAMPRGGRNWDPFVTGDVAIGDVYAMTYVRESILPSQLTAFFLRPPAVAAGGAQVTFEVVDSDGRSVMVSSDGTSVNFYRGTYPLTDGGSFQAEASEQENYTTMIVLADSGAFSGEVVELNEQDEYVEISFGTLDPGDYEAWVRLRAVDATPPGDLLFQVFDAVAAVLATTTVTVDASGTYYEIGPLSFNVASAQVVLARATKVTSGVATYYVDQFRFASTQEPLAAGELTLRATLTDAPGAPGPPAYTVPAVVHLTTTARRHYVREGIETSVDIDVATSDGASVTWDVASDVAWATPTPATDTGATGITTVGVDFTALAAGSRNLATLTFTATGYDPVSVEVVALVVPVDTGANVNISVQY